MVQNLFLIILLIVAFLHQTISAKEHYNDGPYLFYKKDGIEQIDIIKNKRHRTIYRGPLLIDQKFKTNPTDTFTDVEKIAAISDLHGQFNVFKTLLVNNKIIDEHLNWAFGSGHLVITGDIFDRGDTVTEALWLVYKLEQQASLSGGHVHYLLGNHEYLVLRNDQRYLHPKYLATLAHFNNDLRQQYSNESVFGRWLRSKSTIITINGFVFLHGGIHQDFLDLNLSLEEVNHSFRQTIGLSKEALIKSPVWTILHGNTGPIWYRGFFRDNLLTEQQVEHILRQLNAQKIIVGHTSMPEIEQHFNGKVIAIDSSIKRGEQGELLLWHKKQFKRGTITGQTKPME